jgi:hypothetical protein
MLDLEFLTKFGRMFVDVGYLAATEAIGDDQA